MLITETIAFGNLGMLVFMLPGVAVSLAIFIDLSRRLRRRAT